MNNYSINKLFNSYIFYFLCLSIFLCFASINIKPDISIKDFSYKNIINIIRFYSVYFVFFIILIIYSTNRIKVSIFISIYIFYYIFQIIGSYTNETYIFFDINNFYLAFSSIIFLFIVNKLNNYELKHFFVVFKIIGVILFLYLSIYLSENFFKYLTTDYQIYMYGNKDFYDTKIFNSTIPHITGLARVVLIFVNFFFIYFLFNKKNNYLSFFTIVILLFFLWGLQSRGAIILFFGSVLIIAIFNKDKLKKLILLFILASFSSVFLWEAVYKTKSTYLNVNPEMINDNIFFFNRFIKSYKMKKYLEDTNDSSNYYNVNNSPITSGRTLIWKRIINSYDKKKFFGYGVQGDRFILKKLNKDNTSYGSSSSNSLLYALSSGGYLSLLSLIIINIFFLKEVLVFYFKQNKIMDFQYKFYGQFLSTLIIILIARSLIENGHAYFGIDFMIITLAFLMLNKINSSFKISL